MNLVRDVLDKELVDRNGREIGRVDGIVLDVNDGSPPRVIGLEVGPSVIAYRLRPAFARWVVAFERAWQVDEGRPIRISPQDVQKIELDITVNVAIGQTAAENIERRLRRWVRKIDISALFTRS